MLMYKHYANNNKGEKNQHNAVIVYPWPAISFSLAVDI